MSANGATKETLFRVIREKDEEIVRLQEEIKALHKLLGMVTKANTDLLVEAGYIS